MRSLTHDNMYNGFELSQSVKNNQGHYREILMTIQHLLDDMTQRHAKVFFTMFVLKYPARSYSAYPDDNVLLSKFIEALTLSCKRDKCDPKYLWVREYSTAGQVHYHLMMLLNGDRTQNAHGIRRKATELWQRCLGIADASGLVHLCDSAGNIDQYGGVMIRRNDQAFQEVYGYCYQRASYLAKCYSKGESPSYVNEFGHSRVSPAMLQ